MVGFEDREKKAAVCRFPAPVVDLRVIDLSTYPSPAGSVQRGSFKHAAILCCPRCGGRLGVFLDILECKWCGSEFTSDAGVPRLFFPHDVLYGPRDVTHKVKDFYDENPFPKYDDTESRDSLIERSLASPLARLLDEQLPANAFILDAGCGTGHLANFLGLQKHRHVIGGDVSMKSLLHAKRFKDRCGVHNTDFVQMNLFRPPFPKATFDVVIASSVLHHTSDPLRGFQSLVSMLKPDGLFVVSLFNPLGRVGNDVRRLFYCCSRDKLAFLRWRNEKQRVRFIQRYKQPHESRHFLNEIAQEWLAAHEFEFLYSSPRIGSRHLSGGEELRYPRWPGDPSMQFQTELGMLLRGLANDGLFIMIGRNKLQQKRLEAPVSNEIALAATA